jgi:hypothetical protein
MTPATGNDQSVTGNDRTCGRRDRAVVIENDRFLFFVSSTAPSGRKQPRGWYRTGAKRLKTTASKSFFYLSLKKKFFNGISF